MSAKTEEIKVRCALLEKAALMQLAQDEGLPLSEILRRAAKDYVRARQSKDLEKPDVNRAA